ncbi:AAA family ATPase [candidate division KSB1 bacterium]|nr:AAA family ATPase [candidate division KSB1 bacterium]
MASRTAQSAVNTPSLRSILPEEIRRYFQQMEETNKKLEEVNTKLKQELLEMRTNKPLSLAVLAETAQNDHYMPKIVTYKGIEDRSLLLQQVKVVDLAGNLTILPIDARLDIQQLQAGKLVLVDQFNIIVAVLDDFREGNVLPLERVLDDGRLVLKAGMENSEIICTPCGQINVEELKKGDGIRLIGSLALENMGQSLIMDDLIHVPQVKLFEDFVGARWQQQFEKFKKNIRDLQWIINEENTKEPKYLALALYGLAGNGKTKAAMAMAYHAAQAFDVSDKPCVIRIKAAEIGSPYIWQLNLNITNLFKKIRETVKQHSFNITIIDEFDSLAHSGGMASDSEYMNKTIIPQWKAELDGFEALERTLIIVTLNNKLHLNNEILRRFQEFEAVAEEEAIPHLVEKLLVEREIRTDIPAKNLAQQLMDYMHKTKLGTLYFADDKPKDFTPTHIFAYADVEKIVNQAIRDCRIDDQRPVTSEDLLANAQDLFAEKAKRIYVRVDNGIHRSNSRQFFNTLTDEQHQKLDRVVITMDENVAIKTETITV